MDCLLGVVGADYVIMAADQSQSRSIVVIKTDEDKILKLDDSKMLGAAGPAGDRYQFCEFVQKNLHLHEMRTGITLDTKAAASWTRNELAFALRRNPFQVNLLIGGYDKDKGPSLYFMDYLASMHKMPCSAQGYCANFTLSVMDRYYKEDMNLEEGKELIRKCIKELQTRFLINVPNFIVKIADKDGVREVQL